MMCKDMGNTCEIIHRAAKAEVDRLGEWRLSALLHIMEAAAQEHCVRLGIDRDTLYREKGLVWMLSRILVQRFRSPIEGEDLTTRTICANPGNVTFPRWFQVEDAQGNMVCSASSLWVLVDLTSRRIVLPKRAGVSCPDADFPNLDPLPEKLRIPQGPPAFTSTHAVSDDEIDANGHVNNKVYADWLVMPEGNIKAIQLDYNAEVLPGESVNMLYYETDRGYHVSGVVRDRDITAFNARIIK